jgi:citrate lyase gamma subunit
MNNGIPLHLTSLDLLAKRLPHQPGLTGPHLFGFVWTLEFICFRLVLVIAAEVHVEELMTVGEIIPTLLADSLVESQKEIVGQVVVSTLILTLVEIEPPDHEVAVDDQVKYWVRWRQVVEDVQDGLVLLQARSVRLVVVDNGAIELLAKSRNDEAVSKDIELQA